MADYIGEFFTLQLLDSKQAGDAPMCVPAGAYRLAFTGGLMSQMSTIDFGNIEVGDPCTFTGRLQGNIICRLLFTNHKSFFL